MSQNKKWNNIYSLDCKYPFNIEPFTEDMDVEMEFAEYLDINNQEYTSYEEGPNCEYEAFTNLDFFQDIGELIDKKNKIQIEAEKNHQKKMLLAEQELAKNQADSEKKLEENIKNIKKKQQETEDEIIKNREKEKKNKLESEKKEKINKQEQEVKLNRGYNK